MRIIVATGMVTYDRVHSAIEVGMHYLGFDRPEFVTEIIVAEGAVADEHASTWARSHHIAVSRYSTSWKVLAEEGGTVRNRAMIADADALIAVPGKIGNLSEIIRLAREASLLVYIDVIEHGL